MYNQRTMYPNIESNRIEVELCFFEFELGKAFLASSMGLIIRELRSPLMLGGFIEKTFRNLVVLCIWIDRSASPPVLT